MTGRTSWWPCDAAEHDRELNVELGEEFGPAGPLVMRVLKDLAQQQRDDDGRVRTGFRSLRIKTFIPDAAAVRAIVEHAARIGALDELHVDDDGRRFTCRLSGWKADQARGRAAIKKADQRAATLVPSEGDMSPSGENGASGTSHGCSSGASPDAPSVATEGDNDPGSSTEKGTTPAAVTSGGAAVPPTRDDQRSEEAPQPPKGGRQRDRERFEEEMASFARRHFPDAEPRSVQAFASWLRTRPNLEGRPLTAEVMHAMAPHYPAYGLVEEAAA